MQHGCDPLEIARVRVVGLTIRAKQITALVASTVTTACATHLDLAALGDSDPLEQSLVRLVLWHSVCPAAEGVEP